MKRTYSFVYEELEKLTTDLWNTQRDQRVIFNVVNLSKWRTLFADGLTPVVKSTSRPRW